MATAFVQKGITPGSSGAVRDMIILSASCCLFLADRAQSVLEGVKIASEAIDNGSAEKTLASWVRVSNIHTLSTDGV